jgi:hypothetical protein
MLIASSSTPLIKPRDIYEGVGIDKPTSTKGSVSGVIRNQTNAFHLRAWQRNPGGKHRSPPTDDNQREALADFEAEQLRMRYGFDVAF